MNLTPRFTFRPGHGPDSPGYRICRTTVMDSSDPGLKFSDDGDCQYVDLYRRRAGSELIRGDAGKARFQEIVGRIRRRRGVDCICGVSGGVDSSLVLLRAVQAGLKPLAVHMDNGWNDDIAVTNIERLTRSLGVELHTEVVDWECFRDLQRSLFLASVPNVEAATDHVMYATLFRFAARSGLRHILSGSNLSTEAFIPSNSGIDSKDWFHLRSVHSRFGGMPIRGLPHLTRMQFGSCILVRRIRFLPVLNYLGYDRMEAKKELASECGWRDYGRKHGESRFTRFFQEHYLPVKFGVHKIRAHLSCQILAGTISREEALTTLARPCWGPNELEAESEFVRRKLGFTEEEWRRIMENPPRCHFEYPTDPVFHATSSPGYRWIRRLATGRR